MPHPFTAVAISLDSTPDPAGMPEVAFDEHLYRAWHPDVDAAIRHGSLPSALRHWECFGKTEQRAPYGTRDGRFPSPGLCAGDCVVQPLTTASDWLGGIAFRLGTHGHLCHFVMEVWIRDARSGEVLASVVHEEWFDDNEEQVLKFPAIEDCSRRTLALELAIRSINAPQTVHLWCVSTQRAQAMRWNAASCHRTGLELELRYVPLTLVGPQGITLNPATVCKASCIHCLSRTYRERPGVLKPQWISALREHFTRGPGNAWCIDYAADFFRATKHRPELLDLVTSSERLVVNTDGQDVTEPILRRLYSCNTERIGFSCDAATEETYASVRKGLGRLETVVKAAQAAVRLRRELGLGGKPRLAFSMVVMRRNVHEAAQMVELAARAGVDAVWFNQLWVCSEDMVEESLDFIPEIWRKHLARAEERGRVLGIEVCNYPTIRPEHRQYGITWCSEPWGSLTVMGNGEVLACASPASRIGNLNESSIEEIWNGPHLQALRRSVHSARPPLMCIHCPVYRKPGNSDGAFMHHLLHDYDVRRDMADPAYADAFRRRFTFEAHRTSIASRRKMDEPVATNGSEQPGSRSVGG